jgi:Sigma 54 modulation protein / S30EA ribosomal protein
MMLIEVRTDGNIDGGEQFSDRVKAELRTALHRYGDRIRRIDVHLSDAVGNKTSHDDKCCMIEARLDGREPIVVTHQESSMDQAISHALQQDALVFDFALGAMAAGSVQSSALQALPSEG